MQRALIVLDEVLSLVRFGHDDGFAFNLRQLILELACLVRRIYVNLSLS